MASDTHYAKALELWREKHAFLLAAEAVAVTPANKFALAKQIEEIEEKIRELEGKALSPPSGGEAEHDSRLTVFLATVTDDLLRDAGRLRRALRGEVYLNKSIPPPYPCTEHAAAIRAALDVADLTGLDEDDEDEEDDAWYRQMLDELAGTERRSADLEIVRAGRHRFSEVVLAKVRRLSEQQGSVPLPGARSLRVARQITGDYKAMGASDSHRSHQSKIILPRRKRCGKGRIFSTAARTTCSDAMTRGVVEHDDGVRRADAFDTHEAGFVESEGKMVTSNFELLFDRALD